MQQIYLRRNVLSSRHPAEMEQGEDKPSPLTYKSFNHFHRYRTVDMLIAAYETHNLTTPTTLEAIDACQSLVFIICFRNAPEVVLPCSLLFGPAYGLPLQQVVGHEVAMLVAGRTIEIDGLLRKQADKDACQ